MIRPKKEQPSDPAIPLLRRALAESAAATAILLDRDAWPSAAVVHVLAGLGAVLDAIGADGDGDLGDRIAKAKLPSITDAERGRLVSLARSFADAPTDRPDSVARGDVRWATRILHATAGKLLRERDARSGLARWATVAVAAVIALGGLVWIGTRTDIGGDATASGWLARYYPELDFGGDPVIQYDAKIDFDWLAEPPAEDIPADHYTVRWDTCLELPADDTVELRIGSDDGSRVFVDGEQVIDSWRDQAGNWMTSRKPLAAGVHHVRVEYYENGGNALAILEMKSPSGPIPPEWTRPPRLRGDDVACEQ